MKQRLGEIASANKQTNQNSLQAWVEKHSPLEIRTANIARRKLSRTLKKQVRLIPDARQVKLPKTAYIYFASERMATPEFQQKPREMLAKLGQAWKALSESEKEVGYDASSDPLMLIVIRNIKTWRSAALNNTSASTGTSIKKSRLLCRKGNRRHEAVATH